MRREEGLNLEADESQFEKVQSEGDNIYNTLRIKVLLSTVKALFGEVSPPLRTLRLAWNDEEVCLYYYFDGEISEIDRLSAKRVETKLSSELANQTVKSEIIRLDYPARLPQEKGEAVYRRREVAP